MTASSPTVLTALLTPECSVLRRMSPAGEQEVRRPGLDPLALDDGELSARCEDLAAAFDDGPADRAAIAFAGASHPGRAASRVAGFWRSSAGDVRLVEPVHALFAGADRPPDEAVFHLGFWTGMSLDATGGRPYLAPVPLPGGVPGSVAYLARSAVEAAVCGAPAEESAVYLASLLEALALSEPGHLSRWLAEATPSDRLRLADWLAETAEGRGESMLGAPPAAGAVSGAAGVLDRFVEDWLETFVKALSALPATVSVEGELPTRSEGWAQRLTAAAESSLGVPCRVGHGDVMAGLAALAGAAADAGSAEAVSYPKARAVMAERRLGVSPTEQRNPRTHMIDRLDPQEIVDLILGEDKALVGALHGARREIAAAVGRVEAAFRNGGRLFYVGAGTSGRLGVLDASECPPTFRAERWRVQGIISGGLRALYRSSEGAEDEIDAGGQAVLEAGVTDRDVVCGVAASGTTPFVLAALEEAERLGAGRMLVTCNTAALDLLRPFTDVLIALDTGPEVLTGSTRMKAGTATKQALNIITTGAMIRFGKAYGNLMVDLKAASSKLNDRAIRIVRAVTEVDEDRAREVLAAAGWHVKTAIVMIRAGVDAAEAKARLDSVGGRTADAIGSE